MSVKPSMQHSYQQQNRYNAEHSQITTGTFKMLIGKRINVSFSWRSESRKIIRREKLLKKIVCTRKYSSISIGVGGGGGSGSSSSRGMFTVRVNANQ